MKAESEFNVNNHEQLTVSFVLRFLSTIINVYFKSGHFTCLKRYEVSTISDFLSSTGGIFSLFLGCSAISLIEIVYHFIGYLFNVMFKGQKRLNPSSL